MGFRKELNVTTMQPEGFYEDVLAQALAIILIQFEVSRVTEGKQRHLRRIFKTYL